MKEKQQDKTLSTEYVSPLAKEPTYGEKKYDHIFKDIINFRVNLLVSAAFSLWTAHSVTKIKLPFMGEAAAPRVLQQNLADRLERSWVITSMKNASPEMRSKRAFAMAEILTLLTPGNLIMIPSVWLGAKFKSNIVEHYDRKHYGDAAMDDPTIAYRHALVEAEEKPTLLGATVGRLCTVGMSQLAARFIGSEENFVNKIGTRVGSKTLTNFPGINPMASRLGDALGTGAVKHFEPVNALNNKLSKGFDWSMAQKNNPAINTNGPYNRVIQDFSKFTALDTLYAGVTASTIGPIMHLIRNVPGMTYRTRPPVDKVLVDARTGTVTELRVPRNPLANEMPNSASAEPSRESTPHIRISDIKHVERVSAPELQTERVS